MRTRTKSIVVTLVVAVPAFAAEPAGPLGGFWAPHPSGTPTAVQEGLFMILGALEALMLGGAVAFLAFGYPVLRSMGRVSARLTRATHLSIVWILAQWWAHDSLHIHNGPDVGGLLVIDYVFHLPIMAASLVVLTFLLRVARPVGEAAEQPDRLSA